MIRVSVVIPAYRVAPYIRATVESVLQQASEDVEVIVVNDGSPDTPQLEAALEPVRSRIVYLTQANAGVSSARNTGIQAARGEWIAFLDGDDEWLPDYLSEQRQVLASDPGIDMVFPNAVLFGETPLAGRSTIAETRPFEEISLLRALAGEASIGYSSLVRRSLLLAAGLFDTTLHGSEDYNLWIRLLKRGARIVYQPKVLYRYRKRAGSATSDGVWMNERILESFDRIEATLALTPDEASALESHRNKIRFDLAAAKAKCALEQRDSQTALQYYAEANLLQRSGKRTALVLALRLWPKLTYKFLGIPDRPNMKAGPHAREHL